MQRILKSLAPKGPRAAAIVTIAALVAGVGLAEACTRVLYVGEDGLVITGRSMDWGEDLYSICGRSRAACRAMAHPVRTPSNGPLSMAASAFQDTRQASLTA